MLHGGLGVGPKVRGTNAFVRRWAAALERSERPAFVLDFVTGLTRWSNASARARVGDVAGLDELVPHGDARARLRECVVAGTAWDGELLDGTRAFAIAIPGDEGGAAGIYVEALGPAGAGVAGVTERLRDAELEVRRLRRAARWRDAEHAVAMGVGHGLPYAALAAVAVRELARLVAVRDARVTLVDADTVRILAALRPGPPPAAEPAALLEGTPADVARIRRAPVQRPLAEAAAAFPSLRALEAEGARVVLYAPVVTEDVLHGFVELYADHSFLPEEVELTAVLAGLLATGRARERLLEDTVRHAEAMEARAARGREELDRTNEQLLRAAKLTSIGELAAELVHELNQPLNVLGGYVELLREEILPPGSRERALDVMARAVERMAKMADNLRSFARGGTGERVEVDLAAVLTMARELTVGAVKRGVRLECPPGLVVLGDPNRLEQVVVNLLANALQIEGDPVSVRARADGEHVFVEVSDRGPGVPEALRARIFEPFFTTKPAGQGTGLGLSVSARIVQEHGGTLEVVENPGGGALFRVVLPRHHARSGGSEE